MREHDRVGDVVGSVDGRPVTWPYVAGLGFVAAGVFGLLFAPISGIVYIAAVGVVLATWWAFTSRSAFRFGLAASCATFAMGPVALAVLLLAPTAWGRSFFTEDLYFMFVAAGMWVLPAVALAVAAVSLIGAGVRPGPKRQTAPHPADA